MQWAYKTSTRVNGTYEKTTGQEGGKKKKKNSKHVVPNGFLPESG